MYNQAFCFCRTFGTMIIDTGAGFVRLGGGRFPKGTVSANCYDDQQSVQFLQEHLNPQPVLLFDQYTDPATGEPFDSYGELVAYIEENIFVD